MHKKEYLITDFLFIEGNLISAQGPSLVQDGLYESYASMASSVFNRTW